MEHKVYLEVLFSVENDRLGLYFSVFDVDFVAAQDNWDVFTNSYQISVPVGDILVCDTCGYIEHDDGALTWMIRKQNQSKRAVNHLFNQ